MGTLRDDIEQWRSKVVQLLETMEEVRACADRLSECPASELDWQFSTLLEMCEECLSQVEHLREELEEIQSRWGVGTIGNQNFLASIISPTISLANTSADTSIITSIITDLKNNPLAYKSWPWLKMLGDSGELAVLKVLLDVDSEDKLDWSEFQIKPKLESNSGKQLNPDFYVSSCHLICDAKAWQPANPELGKRSSVELNIKSLKETAEKYADAKCLNGGGEMRLYFPEDTYNQQKFILEKLESEVQSKFSNVKIRMCAIPGVNYQDLSRQTRFRYTFLKWLGSPK
ncbi:hypothetical protein [Microcoleus sp. S13_C5]|uniref:hypothetical protein n=1 Tax=Microcoleus sp. S13_C5 TaxID=3055411 RepID=UPI002FD372AE